jgi:hypothetical protein
VIRIEPRRMLSRDVTAAILTDQDTGRTGSQQFDGCPAIRQVNRRWLLVERSRQPKIDEVNRIA